MLFGSPAVCGRVIPFPIPIAGLIFCLQAACSHCSRPQEGGADMTYIENVFLCIASPLLIAALCMGKRQRKFFLFCLAGMGACLLSAYINTFFAALYRADTFTTTTEIAPVVEEVMKFLPLLFYLLIFEPKREQIKIQL